jgi:hypothetical protein
MTNDPERGKVDLLITGIVDKVLTIKPRYIRLRGILGQPVVTKVLIVPEIKYSFNIISATAEKGSNIDFSYNSVKTENGMNGYAITVTNKSTERGHYTDTITLKTTSKYKPEINLIVLGKIG